MYMHLMRVQRLLGSDNFPLISQYFYSSNRSMSITPEYPIVVKVGHVHAGLGKMLLENHHLFEDLAGVLAIHDDYCTAEPFIEGEYDLRIQKIGNHYRVYKRIGFGHSWKTNVGSAVLEEIPLTVQYKTWVDTVASVSGMDILALDVIHAKDGKEYILEVNGSPIGLGPTNEIADSKHMRDLIIAKLQQTKSVSPLPSTELQQQAVDAINYANISAKNAKLEQELEQAQNEIQNLQLQLNVIRSRGITKTTTDTSPATTTRFGRYALVILILALSVGLLSGWFFSEKLVLVK